jgi:ABC-type multidrug transport system ATPase subunit/ABC-type multidrug transport system permease subunit
MLLGQSGQNGPVLLLQDGTLSQVIKLGSAVQTLGRAPDNDIVVASRFVSARHARIEAEGQGHRIVDIGSTNGLLYEGQRLNPHHAHTLADGDVLRIGDPTTGNFVTLTYYNAQVQAARQVPAPQSYQLDPSDTQITIGRFGCDITLDNPQVSRFHAQIDRTPDGQAWLRDVGSSNGTFVNGQRIASAYQLKAGDLIQIGAFKLVYNLSRLDQYDQRGALRIDVRNLSREVSRNGVKRLILKDVSLSIAPREFVALVGGSGTGKSTLMKALSGVVRATSGQVLVNGDNFYQNFDAYRTVLGYVPQDDIIHRELPVRRALSYAAKLRLPPDTAPSEINQRIDSVLAAVDMVRHGDTLVDNLSGGQRKRVSIGAELLADPSLFFLDEPTSGLDPGLEKKMMYTLRRLADSGRTIVLVTHATANITQCDHVIFMADGRMVFFGPPNEALDFFGVTSGDFADIYTKIEGMADPLGEIVQRDLKAEYEHWQRTNPNQAPPHLGELWEMKFRASQQYQAYVVARLQQAPQVPVVANHNEQQQKRPSQLRQLGILTKRYTDLVLQDRRNLGILLMQAPIIGFLLWIVAKADSIVGKEAAQNQASKVLFMLATVAVWFGIINSAREITKETPIYQRERLANLSIVPYVLSKVFILTLLVLIQGLILLAFVGLKVEFPSEGIFLPIWLELFITTFLTSLAGLALGLVISAFAKTPDRSISIVPLALIPQIVFAGLIFELKGAAEPLSWLTISRWSMDAYGSIVNMNRLPAFSAAFGSTTPEARYDHTVTHLLSTWGILALYGLICMIITAVLLKRNDRNV